MTHHEGIGRDGVIGVVVVHYEDPVGLGRVLDALGTSGTPLAAGPAGPVGRGGTHTPVRVVVADDGSTTPPDLSDRPGVELVAQEDEGFRAAAARNLGARHLLARAADAGDHVRALLFLDGDTMPTPGYVEALADAVAALASTAPHGRALAVGRRRYAELDGLDDAGVTAFLHDPDPARLLPDPAWLEEGYAATANLRAADERSYRFVISAVLALSPALFEAVDGFDPTFVGYGGEDWDLAWRAWLAGADLVHVPEALAWHDGPDAAGRDDRADRADDGPPPRTPPASARRLAETRRVAASITEPGARDPGLIWEHPDVVVTVDDRGLRAVDVLLTCADLVRGTDARVWLTDGAILRDGLWPESDPRVCLGPVPASALGRARFRAYVEAPIRLSTTVAALCESATPGEALHAPGLLVVRTRDLARGLTPAPPTPHAHVRAARPDASLEAEWGWRSPRTLPVAREATPTTPATHPHSTKERA